MASTVKEYEMTRWKWFLIGLGILAAAIVVASSFIPWTNVGQFSSVRQNFLAMRANQGIPVLDEHFQAVSSFSILFSLAIFGILILFAIPQRIRTQVDQLPSSFLRLLRLMVLGLLVGLLVLAAGLISVVALGTFPLAIILSFILMVAGLMGFITLAFAFGRALIKRAGWPRPSPITSYLLGLLILFACTRLPYVGPLLFLVLASLGVGATIGSNFGSGQNWNLNPLIEEEKNEKPD
jgi:hypothetical protein